MIHFNVPHMTGNEEKLLKEVLANNKFSGDGPFTKKAQKWLEENLKTPKALLTTSCTDALELAAILIDIREGDEVIMPSYTFVSTANAFALRGATIRFIDIDKVNGNITLEEVEKNINSNTKAVVSVNYAGWACDLKKLKELCDRNQIYLIEDAAQSILASQNGKFLGTFGDISCFSFHETKNIHSGEGGAILINNPSLIEKAEIIREKGTDRSKFLRGMIDKYSWVSIGSSFLPSEFNAAILLGQLEDAKKANSRRVEIWKKYQEGFEGIIPYTRPEVLEGMNGHIFAILTKDIEHRQKIIEGLKTEGIIATFHYLPLHLSVPGKKFGKVSSELLNTVEFSETILRLPMFSSLEDKNVDKIISKIIKLY